MSVSDSGQSTPQQPHDASGGDPFADLGKMRIRQDFDMQAAARQIRLRVPVRKPSKEWFVRVHPDEAYSLDCYLLELKDSAENFAGESYLVQPDVAMALDGESTIRMTKLVTSINRRGDIFLWPIKLPLAGMTLDHWNKSAMEIATGPALTDWVRVAANRSLGAYDCFKAPGFIPGPQWPEDSFSDLLRVAFRDRLIDSVEHDVVRSLRGEL